MRIPFWKMHGGGNDFILVDNRYGAVSVYDGPELARKLCRRKYSIGADGLILIENSDRADFRWRFYNADGSEAEMCGNGARCAARFAFLTGISGPRPSFETRAGIIHAEVTDGRVRIGLSRPTNLALDIPLEAGGPLVVHHLNTGVPHTVIFTDDIASAPVNELGPLVRFHERFRPAGTNVNFVQIHSPHRISIRTYERGVEDETLACGTGSVAGAILSFLRGSASSPVSVLTRGGEELTVYFRSAGNGDIDDVFLEGDAVLVCSGITEEG